MTTIIRTGNFTALVREGKQRITVSTAGGGAGTDVTSSNVTIFVDPTGDDGNTGLSASDPLATLFEATKRVSLFGAGNVIQLSAGQHKLTDHVGLADGKETVVRAYDFSDCTQLRVVGTSSIVTTVTQISTVDNVMTVSDTLVPGAHVGQFVHVPNILFPLLPERFWIIANGINTITVAAAVSSFGGSTSLPTGAGIEIKKLDTRITPPDANSGSFSNQLNYDGAVGFEEIDFDGNNGTGGFAGPTALSQEHADESFTGCKIRNWSQGINGGVPAINACMFEDCTSYAVAGRDAFFGSANFFKNCTTCINAFGFGQITLGAFDVPFIEGCDSYVRGRISSIIDFHVGYYLIGTCARYLQFDTTTGQYSKANAPIKEISAAGVSFTTEVFLTLSGGNPFDLLDSANAIIGTTPQYVDDGVTGVSLSDYNAGTGGASGVRRFNNDKGTFFFD